MEINSSLRAWRTASSDPQKGSWPGFLTRRGKHACSISVGKKKAAVPGWRVTDDVVGSDEAS